MNFFFQIQNLQLLLICRDDEEFATNYVLFFRLRSFGAFCNIIIVDHFLHCFIIQLHLVSSFLHVTLLHVPYAYVSTKSIDCIFLSQSSLNLILLTSSVKTLWISLLNHSSVFNINLLVFINSLWFSLRLFINLTFFLFYLKTEFLLKSF